MRIHSVLAAALLCGSFASAQVVKEDRIGEMLKGFNVNFNNGVHFAADVASLGDLDGNGVGDLAVGAPMDSDGGTLFGSVWVLLLDTDGDVDFPQKISATQGGFAGALGVASYFGSAVASLGDLDGDGVTDLAVGADGDAAGGFRRGAVWIVFLRTDGTVKAQTKITGGVGGFTPALEDMDRFGCALALIGDTDNDGRKELAVGALGDDDGAVDAGAVYILSLNANGTVASSGKISSTSGGLTATVVAGDELGGGLGTLGDYDNDGVEDLAIGMIKFKTGGSLMDEDSGAVLLVSLNGDGSVKSSKQISKGVGGFSPPSPMFTNGAQFGSGIVYGDDYNADGVRDLLVGSPSWKAADGILTGALWVLFMMPDGTVKESYQINNAVSAFKGPLLSGDYFGCSLALLDDFDHNGLRDVAVGALGADVGALDAGVTWVLSLDDLGTKANFMKRTGMGNKDILTLVTTPVTSGPTALQGTFTPPRLGGTTRLQINTGTANTHDQGWFFAFDTPVDLPLPSGPLFGGNSYRLLCIDSGAGIGEILTGSGALVTENSTANVAVFSLVIPNTLALVGFDFCVQGLLRDSTGANRLEVTHAQDVTVGL